MNEKIWVRSPYQALDSASFLQARSNELLFLYVKKGHLKFCSFVEGKKQAGEIGPETGLFVLPEAKIEISLEEGSELCSLTFASAERLMLIYLFCSSYFSSFPETAPFFRDGLSSFAVPDLGFLEQKARDVSFSYRSINKTRIAEERYSLALKQFFLECLISVKPWEEAKGKTTYVRNALESILCHFSDPKFQLKNLPKEQGISPCYLERLFQKEMGAGMKQYLLSLRLQKAERLLNGGQMETKEVAVRSGFKSPQAFLLSFKKRTGLSPAQYRLAKKDGANRN